MTMIMCSWVCAKETIEEKVESSAYLNFFSDIIFDRLVKFHDCKLLHLILSYIQKVTTDPSVNATKTSFTSCMAQHVLDAKIERYKTETMTPPYLGNALKYVVQISAQKITRNALLDLGASVSAISKSLYDVLDTRPMSPCSLNSHVVDSSNKQSFARVNNMMIELHLTYLSADFIIMDTENYPRKTIPNNYICNY